MSERLETAAERVAAAAGERAAVAAAVRLADAIAAVLPEAAVSRDGGEVRVRGAGVRDGLRWPAGLIR